MKHHLKELLGLRPMVSITALFIIGILFEDKFELGLAKVLILLLGHLLLLFLMRNRISISLLISLVMCLGAIRLAIVENKSDRDLSEFQTCIDSVYQIKAEVIETGQTQRGTPKYVLAPIAINDAPIRSGKMILYAKELQIDPEVGDTLHGKFLLKSPRGMRNPSDFDYRAYLDRNGIYFESFLENQADVTRLPNTSLNFHSEMVELRQAIKDHFNKYMAPKSAGIMSALILGERSEVDENTRTDFANTGVIHVLAVSGLHVGYVSLILIIIVGIVRIPPLIQSSLVIIGLLFYVLLTGGAASVMRASIMAGLVIYGGVIERKSDVINVLASAAFIILLIDPHQITNIGFQLSFSAVLSIVLLFPVLQELIPAYRLQLNFMNTLFHKLSDLFLVSLAAQLGTLAITIYYFHKIPIISLIANIVVVPLIGLIVATGLSSLILGSIFPALAILWGALLDEVIDFMLWFVSLCADISWAYLSIRPIHVFELTLILITVFSISYRSKLRLIPIWLIIVLVWTNFQVWTAVFKPDMLEYIMLDVGQGDASILHTPAGKTIVFDAGLKFGGKDMGEDVIAPYLRHRKWTDIDMLVLSHPHNDHIGGAQHLIENFTVKQVLIQDVEYESYGYTHLLNRLDELAIPSVSVEAGFIDSSFKSIYIRGFGPKRFMDSHSPSNVNNISIVLQVMYGETSVLITGDAEEEMENDQLVYGDLLRSNLIKVPHHGSRTSSTPSYIEKVSPDIALISLGENNKYKHPAPETLAKYEKLGSIIHRTDYEGAIIYVSDGVNWVHKDWK